MNPCLGDQVEICTAAKGGMYLKVKVIPKASRNEVLGVVGDRVKVTVRAVPQNGEANAALESTIAEFLGVKKTCCSVIAGYKSSMKTLFIAGDVADEIKAKLICGTADPATRS
jgi:uncharacterized protein (TIGR00251 family)